MDLRAVVFDVGNTLIELDLAAIAEQARSCGLAADVASTRIAEQHARKQFDLHLGTPGSSTESLDSFSLYLQHLFRRLGGSSGWEPLVARRQELWSVLVAGAPSVLEAVAALGFRLAVVSNSDGRIASRLEQAGIADCFEVIIDSGVLDIEKPDPRIFAHALEPMGLQPTQALYIGDLYHVDVKGAEAAGLLPVLLDPLDHRDDVSVARIALLEELPAFLRRLQDQSE